MLLLSAGLQERVEELKQVMQEDKSTKEVLKVRRLMVAVCATSFRIVWWDQPLCGSQGSTHSCYGIMLNCRFGLTGTHVSLTGS